MQLFKPSWVSHGGNPLMSIDIHPDRSRFATGGQDGDAGRVTIWSMVPLLQAEAETAENVPKMLCKMDNHLACVNAVRWSGSGRYLASGGDDKLVMIWQLARESHSFGSSRFERNTECWRVVTVLSGHQGDVLDLSWSSRDDYIASCSVDNSIIIWNARKWGEKVTVLKGHSSMVKGVTWDPIGKYLASQSDDKTVMIWRCMDWQCHKVITKPFESTSGSTHMLRLHWSPDGQLLVSAHAKNGRFPTSQMIKRDGELFYDFVGHRKAVTCVRFCPQILVDPIDEPPNGLVADSAKQGAVNGTVHADDAGEKKKKKKRGPSKEFMCCALGSRDYGISIWITKLGRPRLVVGSLFNDSVTDLAWSRTGQELMACSWDGSVAFMSFADDELGRPMPTEAKRLFMKQLYGNFVLEDLDGVQSSLKSAVLENPDSQISGIATKLMDGFQNSPTDSWSNAVDTPSKPVIRGPVDKQIESRTKDGRRRITPVFIPLTAASPPPGESSTSAFGFTDASSLKVETNGFTKPDSEPEPASVAEKPIEEPVAEKPIEEPVAEKPTEEPVAEKPEAMDVDGVSEEPTKVDRVEEHDESSSDSSSSSGSSSSSSGSSSSSSSEAEESGEDGSSDESESGDEAPQQEVVEKVEEKPEKQESEGSSNSKGSSSSSSDSSDEEMEDQTAKPEAVAETVEEEGAEEEEAEEEEEGEEEEGSSSSESSSEESDEEAEEDRPKSPSVGEPVAKKRKIESSEESGDEVEEDEHGNRAASPRSIPKPPPQVPKPPVEKPAPKPEGDDDRFARRIGPSETLPPPAGSSMAATRAPAAPVETHGEAKPEPKIPRGADKFSARFPTMSPNPDVSVQVDNEAYLSNGMSVHRISCRPRQGLPTWQPWNAVLGSRVTHVGLEQKLLVAATRDGMLHCFRVQTGEYIVSPLALNGAVIKLVTNGDIVAVVTIGAEFSMWDFSTCKNIQRSDVGFLMNGRPRPYVTMLSLFRKDVPIIGLSSGKAYMYKKDLQSWILLLDSSDTARDLVHPSAIRGTSGSAMGQRRAWGFDTNVIPPLLTIQEQLKRNVVASNKGFKGPSEAQQSATMTYLQAQVAAAKDMESSKDYWESLMTLARYYVQIGMETKLRPLLHDLLGPVHGGKSALEWKEEVLSNNKRDMLVYVMDMIRSNVKLQRLHAEFTDMMKVVDLPRLAAPAASTEIAKPPKTTMVNGPTFSEIASFNKKAEEGPNGRDPVSVHP